MKTAALAAFVAAALVPSLVSAQIGDFKPHATGAGNPEVHINADGTMTVKSARVDQIAGTTFYIGIKWGQFPMRFTMKTDGKTTVAKKYGGAATVAALKIGHYIDAEGDFYYGSDFIGLTARSIKNYSLTEESESYSGKIIELNDQNLVLMTPAKNITVVPAPSLVITKGSVNIPWSRLRVGDTVALADGVYDYAKNTLTASNMLIFHSNAEFKPKNFEGTLKRIDGTSLPTSLIVTVGGTDYTVYLSASTKILAKNKNPALLGRFVVGDTLRFYGALKESDKLLADQYVVSADVVRNTSL